jgi:hypothetical protein
MEGMGTRSRPARRRWTGAPPAPRAVGLGAAGLGAIALLLPSCASTSNPCSGDAARDLIHDDPKCRCEAAIQVEVGRRLDLVRRLLDNLRHSDPEVRFYSAMAMRHLSGVDAEYYPHDDASEREQAITLWEAWWQEQQGIGPPEAVPSVGIAPDSAVQPSLAPRSGPGVECGSIRSAGDDTNEREDKKRS